MLRRLTLAILALSLTPAAPAAAVVDFRAGVGTLAGDTTYTIGFHGVHWPLSELAWPLDALVASAGARAELGVLTVEAEVVKNLTADAGKMEDSDWGVFALEGCPHCDADSLDVFSESRATLEALTLKVEALAWYRAYPSFRLGAGAGLRYMSYGFEASDLAQYSPSWGRYGLPFDPFRAMVDGIAITYEVTYLVPYAAVGGTWRAADLFSRGDELAFEVVLGYSPIARATDRDDHVLRDKLSEADCSGSALLAGLSGSYRPGGRFFLFATIELAVISTSGTQTQTFYDEGDHDAPPELVGRRFFVDTEISSTQSRAILGGGLRF